MNLNNIKIGKINHEQLNERRILQACLKNWFSDPKSLHLTEPNLQYPFDYNKWIRLFYSRRRYEMWVLLKDNWIIGFISFRRISIDKQGQLLHLFIDKGHRRNGYGSRLILHIQEILREFEYLFLLAKVSSENKTAIKFFHSKGFKEQASTKNKMLFMEKILATTDK